MKSIIASLLTFALLGTAARATETPNPTNALSMGMYRLDKETAVRVFVTNNTEEKVTVRIKDVNGNLVYTDVVKNYDSFGRKYVLSSLKKGEYTIEISNRNSAVSQTVVL